MSKKQTQSNKQTRTPSKRSAKSLSDRTIALLLALFGFLLYANTLGHAYVMDDILAISSNGNVQKGFAGILDIFTQPYREQCFGGCLYRPLTLTTFAIEWAMSPNHPFIGHLMNVLWYAATGTLLFTTLRKLMPDRNTLFPMMACLLFIVHPIHTEVVANIKSRDEILSLFFIVLAIHQFTSWYKKQQWKSILFAALAFLAALLSKEGAITAMVVFPLLGWIFFKKSFLSSLKLAWWVLVPVGLFFLLRGSALSGFTAPPTHMFDNPLVNAHGTERLGTAFVILLKYFLLLLIPWRLISDYGYNALPLQSFGSPASLIGLVLYGALSVYAIMGLIKKQMAGFFAAAFLISLSLYSQLVILIGTIMSERLLYLPSLWFVLGGTFVLTQFASEENKTFSSLMNWKRLSSIQQGILFVLAGMTIWFSIHTMLRNRDWVNDYTLMKTDAEKSPNSIRLNEGYAEEIYKSIGVGVLTPEELKNRLELSEQYSKKSIAIQPGISSYTNMANISMVRKNYPEALSYYKKIVDLSADKQVAIRNIASFLVYWAKEESEKNDNPSHALELLKQALEYLPEDGEIWRAIGLDNFRLGNLSEAQTALEKAYSFSPTNASIKSDLINFYRNQGMNDKADALQ
jgi:protein O-mannosyl-transferase